MGKTYGITETGYRAYIMRDELKTYCGIPRDRLSYQSEYLPDQLHGECNRCLLTRRKEQNELQEPTAKP